MNHILHVVLFYLKHIKYFRGRKSLIFSSLCPVIPQPWHMENVARLLVLCGDSLCYTVLASKALNGRLTEVSRIIVYIILVRDDKIQRDSI